MQENLNPQKLLQLASNVSQNAYAPYSNFRVGAAVFFEDGSIFTGCNVENASYGLTLCAERNAISTAIASGKTKGIVAIAIYSPDRKLCYPCGACRQWMSEFSKDLKIILENNNGEPIYFTIEELLPHSFDL